MTQEKIMQHIMSIGAVEPVYKSILLYMCFMREFLEDPGFLP